MCDDGAYVSESPIWEGIRKSARRVLDAYGWPRDKLPRNTMVKEAKVGGEDMVPRSRKRRPAWARAGRGGDATLTYHRALLEMLDIEPVVSPPFTRIVEEREQKLGCLFPASIAQLFRLRGISNLFDENAGGDRSARSSIRGTHQRGWAWAIRGTSSRAT